MKITADEFKNIIQSGRYITRKNLVDVVGVYHFDEDKLIVDYGMAESIDIIPSDANFKITDDEQNVLVTFTDENGKRNKFQFEFFREEPANVADFIRQS